MGRSMIQAKKRGLIREAPGWFVALTRRRRMSGPSLYSPRQVCKMCAFTDSKAFILFGQRNRTLSPGPILRGDRATWIPASGL